MAALFFETQIVCTKLISDLVEEIAVAKVNVRKVCVQQRGDLSEQSRVKKSALANAVFLEKIPTSKTDIVALYWPIGDELDCRALIDGLDNRGVVVGLPTIVGAEKPLVIRKFEGQDSLVPASFGTREPSNQSAQIRPNIIVLPLLGFDKTGARLGYGGGLL